MLKPHSLRDFGLSMAAAVEADKLNDVKRAMGHSVGASTSVRSVLAWSTTQTTHKTSKPRAPPRGAKVDDTDGNLAVLGPTEHVAYLDEAVDASVATARTCGGVKIPVAKVTDLSKRTVKGAVTRGLCVGAEKIVISSLDWAGVLAVMTGKTPKVVVNRDWSFGRAGSEDIVHIRHLKSALTGEISVRALNKLI
jgi:hypothetical protein